MKQVEITSKIIGRGGSTTSASPSLDLSGYALISDLLNYVTISGNEDVTGLHDFVNGLKVGGLPITKKQDDVVYLDANLVVRGGITMYGDGNGGSSVPLYSTLGSLLNVDESNDAVASVDRVLFQSAGSNVWSWKALSEIGGGSSGGGGSVSGDYLPLSGGTLTGTVTFQTNGNNAFYINEIGEGNAGFSFQKNGSTLGAIRLDENREPSWMYSKTWAWETMLHSGNYSSYALPLSGGTIKGLLSIRRDTSLIHFGNSGTINYGYLGFSGVDSPVVYMNNGTTNYNLLHSGNYSSYALPLSGGTVTGNVVIDGGFLVAYDSKTTWLNAIPISGSNYFNPDKSVYGNGIAHWVGDWTMRNMLHWRDGLSASGYVTGYTIGSFRRTSSFGGIFIAVSNSDGLNSVGASMEIEGNGIIGINAPNYLSTSNNLLVAGGITMYSDIRKKTKLQDVELSLSQIANAPLIEHYYNSDQNKTTHVGSIAQYWAGLNDWFCKLDNEGYYTMEIQNCALASAISIARHLEKYESKTDKKIRQLKKRISQLEDELELLKKGV